METARRMLKSNKLSLEDIADFSGLSIDEIKQLQNTKSCNNYHFSYRITARMVPALQTQQCPKC